MHFSWVAVLFGILIPLQIHAQGGPPLVTDDTGTPGDGHWEINLASITTISSSTTLSQTPYGDFNYGWGDRVQLKFESGLSEFSGTQSSGMQTNLKTGMGSALAGIRWRFFEDKENDFSMSTYPQYYFGYFLTSSDSDVSQPGNWFHLPVEFSKTFGRWAINPEIGYEFYWQGPNQYLYGLALSYKPSDLELLSEIHSNIRVDGSGTQFLYNIGARYDVNESHTLLFSVGHTLLSFPQDPPEVFLYLGMQFKI